ncbi:MAG: hypothetical protein CL785_03955 [Chloroflexi bacterium]|nr:hypothetical protein [Chloroflexota bacterium]
MQVTDHVWVMHYDDGATAHPGGSNNCFVGNPKKEMILIDTGDHEKEWLKRILDFHKELGSPQITSILITHGHFDHIGGLDRLHEEFQCPVRCHPKLVKKLQKIVGEENVIPLKSRELLHIDDVTLRALFTPGHEVDHVCYYLRKDKVMFTGDSILGSSSSTVQDLYNYMKSLRLLSKFKHTTICPAHGKIVSPPRGGQLVSWYINHREQREKEVMESLKKGITNTKEIVSDIYPRNLKKGLRDAAERNVRTHLAKLIKDGLVTEEPASFKLN